MDNLLYLKMRGMPFETTKEDVMKFLDNVHVVNGEDGLHFLLTEFGQRNGELIFAVPDKEDQQKVLAKDKKYLGRRFVEIGVGDKNQLDRFLQAIENGTIKECKDNCVKLRSMPYEATESDIEQLFHGLDIVPNGITFCLNSKGSRTGIGFVEFANEKSGLQAMGRHKDKVCGRFVEVYQCMKCDVSANQTAHNEGRFRPSSQTKQEVIACGAKPLIPEIEGNNDHLVKLRGLPFHCTEAEVATFFAGIEYVPDTLVMCRRRDGKINGIGFLQFKDEEGVQKALQKHKMELGNRFIEVFKCTREDMREQTKLNPPNQNRMMMQNNMMNNMQGGMHGGMQGGVQGGMHGGMQGGMQRYNPYGRPPSAAPAAPAPAPKSDDPYEAIRQMLAGEGMPIDSMTGHTPGGSAEAAMGGGMSYDTGSNYGGNNSGYGYRANSSDNQMAPPVPLMGNQMQMGGGGYGYGGGYENNQMMGMGGGMGGMIGGQQQIDMEKMKERKCSTDTTTGHTIHMKGLPYKATLMDVVEFMQPLRPVDIRIQKDDEGKPKGRADCDFEAHHECERAMLKDKGRIGQRFVDLFLRSSPEGMWPKGSQEAEDARQRSLARKENRNNQGGGNRY